MNQSQCRLSNRTSITENVSRIDFVSLIHTNIYNDELQKILRWYMIDESRLISSAKSIDIYSLYFLENALSIHWKRTLETVSWQRNVDRSLVRLSTTRYRRKTTTTIITSSFMIFFLYAWLSLRTIVEIFLLVINILFLFKQIILSSDRLIFFQNPSSSLFFFSFSSTFPLF